MGDLGPFTSETWIKETAHLQLTPSHSFGANPALRGQTVKQPRAVFCGPRAADGAAAQQDAPGSSARGAGDSYGGPGAGRDPESHPRRISGPLAAAVDAGTRQPAVPLEAGRRQDTTFFSKIHIVDPEFPKKPHAMSLGSARPVTALRNPLTASCFVDTGRWLSR